MKLTTLIPPQYRLGAILGGLLILSVAMLGIGVTVGWKVSAWRSDAAWSSQLAKQGGDLAEKSQEIADLTASLDRQNAAVEALQAKTDEARQAQVAAQERAAREAKASAARIAELKHQLLDGSSANEIMQSYWEMSR